MKEAQDAKAKRLEEERRQKYAEAQRLRQQQEEELEDKIKERIAYIEKDILSRIKEGEDETTFRFGNGHTSEPVWEVAIYRMRKDNPDYKFELKCVSVEVNYAETGIEEPIWELKITWKRSKDQLW